MIYALGSNLFKAVVVVSAVPAVVSAGPGCCGGHEENAAHDLADGGEEDFDIEALMKQMGMGGEGGLEEMMKNMNFGGEDKEDKCAAGSGCSDGCCSPKKDCGSECGSTCCPSEEEDNQFSCSSGQCTSPCCGGDKDLDAIAEEAAQNAAASQGNEAPANESTTSPPSEEEFNRAKEELGLTEEDESNILEYVKKIPAALKDPKFEDEDIAKMFVHQYFISEDEEPKEGEESLDPKSRDNLLEEIQHLVEVEIPEMMNAQQKQQQQRMGDIMPEMPEMPEDLSPEEMDQALDDMDVESDAPAEEAPVEEAAAEEGMNVEL